jgi:alkanesulfonate monooxygenase
MVEPNIPAGSVQIFSTCPPSSGVEPASYRQRVIDVARWSEQGGYEGILVYSDNSLLDPWLVAQVIIEYTRTLAPLVAVQPIYMHPYTVAKMVASLGSLYGRRVYLNMVAGGFKNDLVALSDPTPHDRRYDRMVEYTTIVQRLLTEPAAVSYAGEFYTVDKLKLTPPLPPALRPGVFVSGSSEAGLAAARALGAVAVKYPKPPSEETAPHGDVAVGIRVGVIARPDPADAWDVAHARFPEDRKGELTHQMAMKVSDSVWHQQLSAMGQPGQRSRYWLTPFLNYKTMCPYLVGGYEEVAEEIGRYLTLGYRRFILDVPADAAELEHTTIAFNRAKEMAQWRDCSRS